MKALSISRLSFVVGLALGTMVLLDATVPNVVGGSNLSVGGVERTTGHDGESCDGTTNNVDCDEINGSCNGQYIRCDTTGWPTCGPTCSCKTTSQTCGGLPDECWKQCDAKCS
ncbi:MAG TPA: hypothetical protein VMW72_11130 [Sedimentisphaerales bacterium]|nr:hypothetical protein [Sedimentisphaerales bacterium]